MVAVEWAGKLHMSVVSEPFFIGSPAHAAAIAALPDFDLSESFVDIAVDGMDVAAWPDETGEGARRPSVIWRVEPPKPLAIDADAKFFKILRGDAFDDPYFSRLAAMYAALNAAVSTGAARPAAIVPAELHFGAGEVCVLMPWVYGRDAVLGDLGEGGVAVAPVADAIVWLARHGLLYVDLREPNVRVDDGCITLVDYDDMAVVTPPTSVAGLRDLLGQHDAAWAGRADVPGARPAVVAALAAAWR
jgi:hypothetical protein